MVPPSKGTIYIFDTSAWVECNDRTGDNRIPTLLQKLHQEGRIKSPKQVFHELQRPGEISDWVQENRLKMNAPRGLPPEYARNLGVVQHRFPGMGRALGGKERADPYVVALALTNNEINSEKWVVVTGESRNNRPRRKITGACDELGLQCIILDEVLEVEVGDGSQTDKEDGED